MYSKSSMSTKSFIRKTPGLRFIDEPSFTSTDRRSTPGFMSMKIETILALGLGNNRAPVFRNNVALSKSRGGLGSKNNPSVIRSSHQIESNIRTRHQH